MGMTDTEYLESPYPFWVFTSATCLGNIFSTRVRFASQLKTEPRFYTVCLGKTGATRKSESGKQINDLFREFVKLLETDLGHNPSKVFNVIYSARSAEGIIERLKKSSKLVIIYDEFRSFVKKCEHQGSNLLQFINSLFENTYYDHVSKDKYLKIDEVTGKSPVSLWGMGGVKGHN